MSGFDQLQLGASLQALDHVTTNSHNKDNRGVFFDLVKAVYPMVNLSNPEYITDNTIINGIKLAKKP